MNPRDHVIQTVIPAYEAFLAYRQRNIIGEGELRRLALEAANALFHLREHIPSLTSQAAGEQLRNNNPDYALLGDIANAGKHHTLTQGKKRRLTKSEQIYEASVRTYFADASGEYVYAQAEVVAKLDDGTRCYVADVLHNVLKMWRAKLAALGDVDIPSFDPPRADVFRTRQEAAGHPLTIENRQGEERQHHFEMRQWDSSTSCSKPINLEGRKVMLNVSKLPESGTLTFGMKRSPESEMQYGDFEVPIPEERREEYVRKSGKEKAAMLQAIVEADPELVRGLEAMMSDVASRSSGEKLHVKIGADFQGKIPDPKQGQMSVPVEYEREEDGGTQSRGQFVVKPNPYLRKPK